MADAFEPTAYRRWYQTPLGKRVDADEKAVVFRVADLKRGERVLDVGCGDGTYTEPAAERTGCAIGLDRSVAMLRAAEQRTRGVAGLRWIAGDATGLPFEDAVFDAVLIVTVLCFAGDPQKVVDEAFRVLRPGGRLVLGELGRYSTWALVRRLRGLAGSRTWRDARLFTRHGLGVLVTRAGFRDVTTEVAVFYPPSQRLVGTVAIDLAERVGRRYLPAAGAFLAVCGRRP